MDDTKQPESQEHELGVSSEEDRTSNSSVLTKGAGSHASPLPLDVVVIGIAGPTRAGKSTLCRNLVEKLNAASSKFSASGNKKKDAGVVTTAGGDGKDLITRAAAVEVVHQDLFLSGGETPDCVNWRSFQSAIQKSLIKLRNNNVSVPNKNNNKNNSKRKTKFLILEGFLLYSRPAVADLCHVKIFLELTKEVCYARRKATKRCGLAGDAFDRTFEKSIWSSYLQFGAYSNNNDDMHGEQPTKNRVVSFGQRRSSQGNSQEPQQKEVVVVGVSSQHGDDTRVPAQYDRDKEEGRKPTTSAAALSTTTAALVPIQTIDATQSTDEVFAEALHWISQVLV